MSGFSPYPRYFKTPEGRSVSIQTMSKALRTIRQRPDINYRGWQWYAVSGHAILRDFRRGLHHRINARGELLHGC